MRRKRVQLGIRGLFQGFNHSLDFSLSLSRHCMGVIGETPNNSSCSTVHSDRNIVFGDRVGSAFSQDSKIGSLPSFQLKTTPSSQV
jgi:hypothetical protein